MKRWNRVALIMGLTALSAVSLEAAETMGPGDELATAVYVVNNYQSDVRVFAEDSAGKLHSLGRVSRGDLGTFAIPESMSEGDFRIKVVPTAPVWAQAQDDYGVKTNPLNARRDRQVRVWLEADLTKSLVEIERS
jgi:hypothetical protein